MLLWPGQGGQWGQQSQNPQKDGVVSVFSLVLWDWNGSDMLSSPPASDSSFLSSDLSSLCILLPPPPPYPAARSPRPALMEKEIWGIMSWFSSIFVNLSQNYSPEEISHQNTALSSLQFKHIFVPTIRSFWTSQPQQCNCTNRSSDWVEVFCLKNCSPAQPIVLLHYIVIITVTGSCSP